MQTNQNAEIIIRAFHYHYRSSKHSKHNVAPRPPWPTACIHRSCPDSVGSQLTLRKWKKCGEQKNTLTLPVYARAPWRAQSAIHHICISICILTSHTYATVNKPPFVRKHVLHSSLMYTLRVHTNPQPSRCAYSLFFLDHHVRGSSGTVLLCLPLWCHRSIHFSKRWQIVSSLLICHPFPT